MISSKSIVKQQKEKCWPNRSRHITFAVSYNNRTCFPSYSRATGRSFSLLLAPGYCVPESVNTYTGVLNMVKWSRAVQRECEQKSFSDIQSACAVATLKLMYVFIVNLTFTFKHLALELGKNLAIMSCVHTLEDAWPLLEWPPYPLLLCHIS